MTRDSVVTADGRLTDWISLVVLTSSVSRLAVDGAVGAPDRWTGGPADRRARRSDGKLPPHVMVYFVMAVALLADDDYEEVAARLTETLALWECWDEEWSVPTSAGSRRLPEAGYESLAGLLAEVAVPVAGARARALLCGKIA